MKKLIILLACLASTFQLSAQMSDVPGAAQLTTGDLGDADCTLQQLLDGTIVVVTAGHVAVGEVTQVRQLNRIFSFHGIASYKIIFNAYIVVNLLFYYSLYLRFCQFLFHPYSPLFLCVFYRIFITFFVEIDFCFYLGYDRQKEVHAYEIIRPRNHQIYC